MGLVQFQVFFGDECDCEKRQQRCFGDECLKNTLRKDNKYMQPLQRKKLCIQFSCSKQLHKFKTNSAFGNIDVQNLDLHSLSNLESVIGGIFLQHDRSNQISQEKVFKNTYLEFPSWSSHLAGVDQPTLSVSEHFRRWAILKIPFPLPHRQRLQNVWRWTLCN